MLDDAGRDPRDDLFVGHKLLIHPLHANAGRPAYVLVHPGEAEATLVECVLPVKAFQDVRIDECSLESGQLGLLVGKGGCVYHEEPDGEPYLRCGESHAVRLAHGLPHVY